ncbi:MAG: D-alanyl-D-alanine endopeptidase [Burkholderiaceae bacterium]|jgi:D-alanyl-D-alanine endopeptidase (penicillin-binding protein 7)
MNLLQRLLCTFFCTALLVVSTGLSSSVVQAAEDRASKSVKVKPKKQMPTAKKHVSKKPAASPSAPKKPPPRLAHAGVRPVSVKRFLAAETGSNSFGQQNGLHSEIDPLSLKSAVAFVQDLDTKQILFAKNSDAVLPIASITKLMTALVVLEARQPLDDILNVTDDDVDTEKNSRSRLRVGTELSRSDMIHLALMSSENRAAHCLGRYYPGGLRAAVAAMNAKAAVLGMRDTHFVEPTGLSSNNVSSGPDLAKLVNAAYSVDLIREYSTDVDYAVSLNRRRTLFVNTNPLIQDGNWEISVSKTGFISEAGRCLVMHARIEGRRIAIVLLDSLGKYSRLGDANRLRHWLETRVRTPLNNRQPT